MGFVGGAVGEAVGCALGMCLFFAVLLEGHCVFKKRAFENSSSESCIESIIDMSVAPKQRTSIFVKHIDKLQAELA